MRTSDVIDLAADQIQVRGWATGNTSSSPWGGGAGTTDPLCMEGAIAAAMGINLTHDCAAGQSDLVKCAAYRAVSDHVGLPEGSLALFLFNDQDGMTAEGVIATLRSAAVTQRVREDSYALADAA